MKRIVAVVLLCFLAYFVFVSYKDAKEENKDAEIVTLSVYLDADATNEDVKRIEDEIKNFPGVFDYEFVSKEQAYKEAVEEGLLSVESEYFQGIENPLPDKFTVEFESKNFDDSVQRYFENIEGVDVIKYSEPIEPVYIPSLN